MCKFTPLGFETEDTASVAAKAFKCKFTPLGFETCLLSAQPLKRYGVNLPRWGLKPS